MNSRYISKADKFIRTASAAGFGGLLFHAAMIGAFFVVLAGLTPQSNLQARAKSAPARRTLWVSPTASSSAMMNEHSVAALVEQARLAGFDAIILYVKEINGHVIYPSRIAPRLTQYKGVHYPAEFDALKVFIEETHKRHMLLHAAFETFSEGHKLFPGVGLAYTTRKDWQTVAYDVDAADNKIKRAPWAEFKQGIPLFVNAALPAVQDYELSIVEEVLKTYNVDAVVFDRARWQGINADFSDFSREQFAKRIHDPALRWPEDIYEIKVSETGKKEIVEGRYYRQWLEWRAQVIHDYFARLRALVHRVKNRVSLEDYVGSWYPTYNELGVNWASEKYKVPYPWATPGYGATGYAQFLDVLYIGLYYPDVTEVEALDEKRPAWRSVEGAAKLAREVTMDSTYIQGVINFGDSHLSDEQLAKATSAVAQFLDGVSIFEASHVQRRNQWPLLADLLKKPTLSRSEKK